MNLEKKINYLDQEFLDLISTTSIINKENLNNDLIDIINVQVKIVDRADKVRRKIKHLKREYDKIYAEKDGYYRYKHEIVPKNDFEKDAMIRADDEIQEYRKLIESYESDMEKLSDLKDIYKQKYWNIKSIQEWSIFQSGK